MLNNQSRKEISTLDLASALDCHEKIPGSNLDFLSITAYCPGDRKIKTLRGYSLLK